MSLSIFPLQRSGNIYAPRYTYILAYENKLNSIFEKYYRHKAKSLSQYEFNVEHSDRYSGDNSVTSKRHSIDEPFSRQHRQKRSDINMPESSQNGGASDREDYERALGELLNSVNNVDNMTYSLASQCLQDPKILYAYSRLPTMERKISFVQLTWRLKCDPNCVLEVSRCFVFCLYISYMIINSFRSSTVMSVIYTYCSFDGILSRTCHQPIS